MSGRRDGEGGDISVDRVLEELHRYLRSANRQSGQNGDAGRSPGFLVGVMAARASAGGSVDLHRSLSEQGLEAALGDLLEEQNRDFGEVDPAERSIVRILDHAFRKLQVRPGVPDDLLELVLRLELPVAGMVLKDPGFLGKHNHPGRRLINEIFRASSTFLDGEDSVSDPLRREVDKVVGRLSALDLTPRELTGLLSEFIDFVDKDKKRQILREQRLLEEEEAAARVSMTHTFIHERLAERVVGRLLPRFLVRFIEDAWSKVIFLEVLRNGQDSPEGRGRLEELDELLSVPETLSDQEAGELCRRIEDALEDISLEPAAQRRWLTLFDAFFASRLPERTLLPPGQAFEITEVESLVLRLPGIALAEPPDENADTDALESLEQLRSGVWVEFRATEQSEAFRCKLAGVVSQVGKYVFTNRRGAKVAEESRNRLAFKMKAGNVVVLDNSHLFDEAYQEVLQELQHQSAYRHGRKPIRRENS